MLNTLQQLAGTAFVERVVLWLNHVLASEDVALQRLRPHAGRCIELQFSGWPALLPKLPELRFVITPAGLLEWSAHGPAVPADLRLAVDASNPALALMQGLSGQRPAVDVSGDAALAADAHWLMDNLRWDVQDDLARLIGPAPAHELARIGAKLADGLRRAAAALAGSHAEAAPRPPGPRAR